MNALIRLIVFSFPRKLRFALKPATALACAALFAGLSSPAARASEFTFSFSGASDSGSGLIDATETATPGKYTITAISGTTDGQAIGGLLTAESYPFVPYASNDNLLFFPSSVNAPNTTPGAFDIYGVSFSLSDGTDVNIYYGDYIMGYPNSYNLMYGIATSNDILSSFSIAPVLEFGDAPPPPSGNAPEPSSLVLLGTGILAAAGALRSRIPNGPVAAPESN